MLIYFNVFVTITWILNVHLEYVKILKNIYINCYLLYNLRIINVVMAMGLVATLKGFKFLRVTAIGPLFSYHGRESSSQYSIQKAFRTDRGTILINYAFWSPGVPPQKAKMTKR